MNVKWSPDAKAALDKTSDSIMERFGIKAKMKFKKEVRRVNDLLKTTPYWGPFEPLLADLPDGFRSIVVNHLNKIVYYIEDDTIYIADFWDTRKEPQSQAQQTKDNLKS